MIPTLLSLTLTLGGVQPAPSATPLPQLGLWTQVQLPTAQGSWAGPSAMELALLDPCEQVANLQAMAALHDVQDDYQEALALAANTPDLLEAAELTEEAWDELLEGLELASDVFDFRVLVCSMVGGGYYQPEIEPEDFSATITNPLLPYAVGATWTYQGMTDEGLEVIEVEVLDETREILGVDCRVVRDTVTLEGEVIEDTWDYYAQDDEGNVWYFGEMSFEFEDGYIVNMEGSWISGEDDAHPGIVMQAAPYPGLAYRQEYLMGEAEDAAQVVSMTETVSVPAGRFSGCLHTYDVAPLEPDVLESKFYARGIGLVQEVDEESGESVELISWSMP